VVLLGMIRLALMILEDRLKKIINKFFFRSLKLDSSRIR